MKQYLIALALTLALNAGAAGVQPRHRHHPPTEQVDPAQTKQPSALASAVDSSDTEGIEAYSDTTSAAVAGGVDSVYQSSPDDSSTSIDFDTHPLLRKILGGTIGVGGTLIAVVVVLAILLCVLAPFIVLIFLLRYLINRHNNRVTLAEKAMETGQPIPDNLKPVDTGSAEFYRQKGIKNTAIGVGLFIMFWIWDSGLLMGIGALVACYGIGQIIIGKTSK
jgi:hypothetical protein